MKPTFTAMAALGAIAAAPAAFAQPPDQEQAPALGDWYVSGFVGGAFLQGAKN